jgi:5-oxoprolinase (ATP-hydrolysing)
VVEVSTMVVSLSSHTSSWISPVNDSISGDGMDKMFEARMDLNCSIVSQRRVFPPLGLKGGGNGARGKNLWFRKRDDGGFDEINMGNNGLVKMRKGDRVNIQTPGGAGWGAETEH